MGVSSGATRAVGYWTVRHVSAHITIVIGIGSDAVDDERRAGLG